MQTGLAVFFKLCHTGVCPGGATNLVAAPNRLPPLDLQDYMTRTCQTTDTLSPCWMRL